MASQHSVFHRDAAAASDADRQCDAYRNHGAYVSSVAQNASHEGDNESRDHDERDAANRTHDDNETEDGEHARGRNASHERDDEARENAGANRTHEDDADVDDGEANVVRDAAHSDIGKCGGHAQGDGSQQAEHEDADVEADASHGRSSEARAEHAPHNDQHP